MRAICFREILNIVSFFRLLDNFDLITIIFWFCTYTVIILNLNSLLGYNVLSGQTRFR